MRLLFDMDGTLIDSGGYMTPEQKSVWLQLTQKYDVTIVSGARREKILQHIPGRYTILAQSGNDAWSMDGESMWRNEITDAVRSSVGIWLASMRAQGHQVLDTEDRGCQLSVSLVGHYADREIKRQFDPLGAVRRRILSECPPAKDVVAGIGGTTCIDFSTCSKGTNVARFVSDSKEPALYFGDAVFPGGNDWSVIKCGAMVGVIAVNWPSQTHQMIKWLV